MQIWGCEDVNLTKYTTRIKIYYKPDAKYKLLHPYATNKAIPLTKNDYGEGYVIEQDETIVIENKYGQFAGTREFNLIPEETLIVEIEQDITIPFEYYLDSLSTFSKADHEKITIYGENISVEFNENYPVKKVLKNEWVWEYNNIDTKNPNLKNVLIISKDNNPEPPPQKSFFQKIIEWFRNLFS